MFLIKTAIDGAVYKLQPLRNQAVISDSGYDIEDVIITGPIAECAKSPLGSIFIASKYDNPESDTFNIRPGELIPLFYNDSVFPLSSESIS